MWQDVMALVPRIILLSRRVDAIVEQDEGEQIPGRKELVTMMQKSVLVLCHDLNGTDSARGRNVIRL